MFWWIRKSTSGFILFRGAMATFEQYEKSSNSSPEPATLNQVPNGTPEYPPRSFLFVLFVLLGPFLHTGSWPGPKEAESPLPRDFQGVLSLDLRVQECADNRALPQQTVTRHRQRIKALALKFGISTLPYL